MNFFEYSCQNAITLIGSTNLAPCLPYQAITCHLLQHLSYKVQEKAFVYLFPPSYNEAVYHQNLIQHGAPIANRGRNEYETGCSKKFEILNHGFASILTLLLVKPIGWGSLDTFILIHYLFVIRILAVQVVATTIILVHEKIHQSIEGLQQRIPIFFNSTRVPKPNLPAKEKARKILELLKGLQKIPTFEARVDLPDTFIDWITTTIPAYPIKEKDNPLHFWDITTLENLLKKSLIPNCPNGCGRKLELENTISTDLQDKIIKLLEETSIKYWFALLPFKENTID